MLFPPLARRSLRWRPVDGEGLEHLDLTVSAEGVRASSVVVGTFQGRGRGIRYEIACDRAWRLRSLRIEATDGAALELSHDGEGRWYDADGRERRDLAGATDIDLSGSPFTNTLPIRRLALRRSEGPVDLTMVYVPFETLRPFLDRQRYTSIDDGRLYRFESADGSFEASLPLDEDGLVIDYPGLFVRT